MLNSQIIERKIEVFLNTIFKSKKSTNRRIVQKQKFKVLSKLVTDLFHCKNCRECFKNISSLIILILNIYIEKFPVDIYSFNTDDSLKISNSNYKDILKKEFLID